MEKEKIPAKKIREDFKEEVAFEVGLERSIGFEHMEMERGSLERENSINSHQCRKIQGMDNFLEEEVPRRILGGL